MQISFSKNLFHARLRYDERDLIRDSGFQFNPLIKKYVSKCYRVAARLRKYFDDTAENQFKRVTVETLPWSGSALLPLDKSLDAHPIKKPFQEETVKFVMERNASYLALEQRLGKTVISVCVMNTLYDEDENPIYLVIVPPFLITVWERTIKDWNVFSFSVFSVRESRDVNFYDGETVIICPDSLVIEQVVKKFLKSRVYKCAFIDEAHRFNNPDAKRTVSVLGSDDFYGVAHYSEKKVFLSGTPMSRPVDLFPILNTQAKNVIDFRNYAAYVGRYCNATVKRYGHKEVLDVRGISNHDELFKKLQKFMTVKKFKDYVETKGYVQNVVPIDGKISKELKTLETSVLSKTPIKDLTGRSDIGGISAFRKQCAKDKMLPALQYILNVLEGEESQLLVFGIHEELLLKLYGRLQVAGFDTALIKGGVSNKERTAIEDKFRNKKIRVIVANLFTMVGIDLSNARKIIFVESSWTKRDNEQAIFRALGMRQEHEVFVDHLTLANTLDEYVLNSVKTTMQITNKLIRE